MFDTDGNQRVDKAEFLVVRSIPVTQFLTDFIIQLTDMVQRNISRFVDNFVSARPWTTLLKTFIPTHEYRLGNCWEVRWRIAWSMKILKKLWDLVLCLICLVFVVLQTEVFRLFSLIRFVSSPSYFWLIFDFLKFLTIVRSILFNHLTCVYPGFCLLTSLSPDKLSLI